MLMPETDPGLIARRGEIVAALRRIVPGEGVIHAPSELRAYECDALTAYAMPPLAVVLPQTVPQVAAIMAYCSSLGLKVVPRGAGTSLSGGALPLGDGIVLGLGRFNRILDIDYENRCVVTQPGVTNLAISQAVEARGFYYAPDPSSQVACSIGGNVAENSGGIHCLKYGMTTNNLLGCELVLCNGEIVRLGGKAMDPGGLDLLGIVTGSEGLLGVVTEVTVRILQRPQTQRALLLGFPTVRDGSVCVAAIIGAGIIPAGMEMMDKVSIHATEAFVAAGYPLDVEAAFPAIGRMAADYYCVDGTIPRRCLPQMIEYMAELSERYQLRVANVFHAGDGNLHPLICYDASVPGGIEQAEAFGADILRRCVEVGGVLTGEHGVGVEKRDLMEVQFTQTDLDQQQRLKCAFDAEGLLNPGKVFPKLCRCAELGRVHVHAGQTRFPDLLRL